MAVDATLKIVGIKEALAALNRIDKSARREITRDFKRITEPVVSDAQNAIPLGPPLSGMQYNWTTKSGTQIFPWGLVEDYVEAKVSGKKPKMFGGYLQNLATFYIRFTGPSATIIDMSGKGKVPTNQGGAMVAALNRRFNRSASRILWPAYERHQDELQDRVQQLVDRVMLLTQNELK